MTIAVFVNPIDCTIERVEYKNSTEMLDKCREFVGTTDLGHCTPIPTSHDGIICGNFHDDCGLDRHFYGILIKGYSFPILGPSCFYAEKLKLDINDQVNNIPHNFPYRFIPGKTLLWMMKDPKTMTIIRRPEDHIPVKNHKTKMN